jgi:hypothetical protein
MGQKTMYFGDFSRPNFNIIKRRFKYCVELKLSRKVVFPSGGTMWTRRFLVFPLVVLVSLFLVSVGEAQLGPKEGATLKPTDLQRVKVGDPAPDFALEDFHGKTVTLSSYRGAKNVVLVFYRGHW